MVEYALVANERDEMMAEVKRRIVLTQVRAALVVVVVLLLLMAEVLLLLTRPTLRRTPSFNLTRNARRGCARRHTRWRRRPRRRRRSSSTARSRPRR